MIELKGGLILGKNAPKEEISFSYEKGQINRIPFEEKYKFAFLSLKDQALDKGEFFIDETKIYPNEDNEKTIFFLAVNSVIKLGLCFLVNKAEKKEKVKFVQDELITLRDHPMNTDNDKNLKIAAIFAKICALLPSYVLINLNDEANFGNAELDRQLELNKGALNLIVLDLKPVQKEEAKPIVEDDNYEMVDISIGAAPVQPVQKQKKQKVSSAKKGDNFFKRAWLALKENIMVFLAFVIPMIGVVAFILLSPLYAATSNKVLIIPFVITIVICFVLYMLMSYKCTDFGSLKDKDANRERILFFTVNSVISLIGYGLGFLIYFLFKKFDTDLANSGNNVLGIVLSIVFYLILISSTIYINPLLSPLINKIKKKK